MSRSRGKLLLFSKTHLAVSVPVARAAYARLFSREQCFSGAERVERSSCKVIFCEREFWCVMHSSY